MRSHLPTSMLVALLLSSTPAPVAAQSTVPQGITPVAVSTTPARSDLERAERLEAQAERDAEHTRRWRDAATLRLRAACLRKETAGAIDGYQRAAWLFEASGDHDAGRKSLEEAVRVALYRGDAPRALNLLMDATLMAAAGHDARQADRLMSRTRSLLESAVIPEELRTALRARTSETAHLAAR